jgi:hypothetical protein
MGKRFHTVDLQATKRDLRGARKNLVGRQVLPLKLVLKTTPPLPDDRRTAAEDKVIIDILSVGKILTAKRCRKLAVLDTSLIGQARPDKRAHCSWTAWASHRAQFQAIGTTVRAWTI